MLKAKLSGIFRPFPALRQLYAGLVTRRRALGALASLLVASLITAGLAGLLLWSSGPAQAQDGDTPPAVDNLHCIVREDVVGFFWEEPEWSGGNAASYDYRLTLPGGAEESGNLRNITSVIRWGEYQSGQAARFSITTNYETAGGSRVTGAEATLTCYVGGEPETPNQAPTVASSIGDATIFHESGTQSVSLSGTFSDADNDSLTITAASSNEAVATVSVASDRSSLTVSAQSRGEAEVTVTADDGNGGTVSDAFTVTVKAAPVVASPLADISGLEVKATREASLAGVFSDADGDSLTVTAASSKDGVARVLAALDGSKLTVAAVSEGEATITATAEDADGNTVSDAFDVSVVARAQQQRPALSSDATLSGLALLRDGSGIPLRPAFDPQTTEYGATAPVGSGWVTLKPTANHAGATITVDGKVVESGSDSEAFFLELNTPKRVEVAVAAEDGVNRRVYAVTATHDPRAELSGLSLSAGTLHPLFCGTCAEYRAVVPHSAASVTVTPTNRHARGTITVNGQTVASGQASEEIALAEGANVITVQITAPDNHTSRSYRVTVVRATATASGDATLQGLAVHTATGNQPDAGNDVPYAGPAYPLTPELTAGVYDYRVRVPEAVVQAARVAEERVYVTAVATTTAPGARSMVVSGKGSIEEAREPKRAVVTGEASGPWWAFTGHSLITVEVTSLDGSSTQTYRVLVEQGSVDDPQGVSVAPGDGQLTLSWAEYTGSKPPTRHWARWREAGTTTWLNRATLSGWKTSYGDDAADGTAADGQRVSGGSHVITGLTNGTEYEVELRADRGGDTSYGVTNWLKSGWVAARGTPGQATRPLVITPGSPTREYGGTDDLSYAVSGLVDGDAAGDVVTGALSRASGNDAGSYAIGMGTLAIASAYADKYTLPSGPAVATYTITPRSITAISGVAVDSRPADGSTAATFDTSGADGVGVLASELADFQAGGLVVSGAFPAATPGTHSLSVTYSLQDSGTFKAANYTLSTTTDTVQGELSAGSKPVDVAPCPPPVNGDYDADDDGLIEICSLAQLNAIRWDPDGDGQANNSPDYVSAWYSAAFTNAVAGMGCPQTGCKGYELVSDLDFAGNDWPAGASWVPIGLVDVYGTDETFAATFQGNGHTISNLYVAPVFDGSVGLFETTSSSAVIVNLNLESVNIIIRSYQLEKGGGLVGFNRGTIINTHVSGVVGASGTVGGLVGVASESSIITGSSSAARVAGGKSFSTSAGGLVGANKGSIIATYASGEVLGGGGRVGGLVGEDYGRGYISTSYAVGRVASDSEDVGGLVGEGSGYRINDSYWDIETTWQSDSAGGVGKTTAQLQQPTDYTGIYRGWNLTDVDLDGNADSPWDFGTSCQYPALKNAGISVTAQRAQMPDISATDGSCGTPAVTTDYDADDDGLIEVSTLAQLNAIRWDWLGDGTSSNAGHAAAFPNAATRMGCPFSGCTGYELTTDLDFDTNGNGQADAGDVYWNGGRGWYPIGGTYSGFATVFEGNGHTIRNLYISRINIPSKNVGLFGYVDAGGVIRNVGLDSVKVSTTGIGTNRAQSSNVGALAGYLSHRTFNKNGGTISNSWVAGEVSGRYRVGGLVGMSHGRIIESVALVSVTGNAAPGEGGEDVGGLVGYNAGKIQAGYAAGRVSNTADNTGGLVGYNHASGSVTASYAIGEVSGDGNHVGGLVGKNSGTVAAGYWDTQTSRQSGSAGGAAKTTAELQQPTGYTGIYANWNVDLDGDNSADDPWDFGTPSQYPVLKRAGLSLSEQRALLPNTSTSGSGNRAPTVVSPIADGTIVNLRTTRNVDLSGVFNDADNDPLTITTSSSNEAVATVSKPSQQLLNKRSNFGVTGRSKGTATITVTADDGNGGTVSDTFTVTVKVAPALASALADISGLEVDATQDVSLTGVFSDADGDALTISATSSDDALATVTVASDGSKLTVAGVSEGTATITVTAQDADDNRVSDTFDAPVAKQYAGLIAQMREWRDDSRYVSDKAHTDRWDRALLAFGETVSDTTLTPMPASEAQTYADRGWTRWVEVAAALRKIEAG